MAERRLQYLGRRLEKGPEMHQKNRDKMKEYSENEAAEVVRERKEMLDGSGFHLTKFLSNNQGSLSSVSKEDCRVSQGKMDINSPRTKMALEVTWTPGLDEFHFQIRPTEKAATRRGTSLTLSQCYDSVGMIQAALLPAQKLLQELWFSGLEWDDPITSENSNSDFIICDAELLKCHQVLPAVCKTTSEEADPLGPLLNYFSTFTKLKRAVAWFARLTKIIRGRFSKARKNLMLGPVLFASKLASAELDIV